MIHKIVSCKHQSFGVHDELKHYFCISVLNCLVLPAHLTFD